MSQQLPWGDYALVCYTLMATASDGSTLYQQAYSSAFFRIV